MMKKSNIYKVFLLLPLFATISTSNEFSRQSPEFSSPDCKTIVCEQAQEQAKGLSQLALLDEFVSQTVLLLRDLMQTMDGEIEKSAKSLLRYIHPHCSSTQRILEEVIEKQGERMEASPLLGQGIKPMEEDEPDKDDKSITFGKEQQGNYDYIDKRGQDVSQSYDLGDYDSRNTDVQESTSDYDINKSEGQFSGRGWNSQWTGIEKRNQEKSHKSRNRNKWEKETSEKTRFSHQSREGKTILKPEFVERDEDDLGYKICKGVDKGSAFWVPNLDQWCQDNCSKGYCPKTHCIC